MKSTRQLATIAEIESFKPIVGADRIRLALFKDRAWEVIVDLSYNVGDRGILFEVDSFLPVQPRYEVLRKSSFRTTPDGQEGFRIKTFKMRGAYSQGFFLSEDEFEDRSLPTELGADCTELLGILQWPDPVDDQGRKSFPSFVPKTDAKRIENFSSVAYSTLSEQQFVWTEKLDGTSFTAFWTPDQGVGYCSRNFLLDTADESHYKDVVQRYQLEDKLKAIGKPIAIQGEIIGPKIQRNHYARKENELLLFGAWDIATQKRIPLDILQLGIPTVPIVKVGSLPSIGELRASADGPSLLHKTAREGLVLWREGVEPIKVISREYLSKQN